MEQIDSGNTSGDTKEDAQVAMNGGTWSILVEQLGSRQSSQDSTPFFVRDQTPKATAFLQTSHARQRHFKQ